MTHTPTPWLARKGDTFNPERTWGIVRVLTPDEHGCDPSEGERTEVIAEVYDSTPDDGEGDAQRIVACVNACVGIDTYCLENHSFRSERDVCLKAIEELKAERDAALRTQVRMEETNSLLATAMTSARQARDQLRAALDRVVPCLEAWVEIADDEDRRDEDDEALEQARIALQATEPAQSTLPLDTPF